MKRILCFMLALCICACLAACGDGDSAKWIENGAADKLALKCSVNVKGGVVSNANYIVAGDNGSENYVYSTDKGVQRVEGDGASDYSDLDGVLTMADLERIFETIMQWVPENLPDRKSYYGIATLLPKYAFLEPVENAYVYSLETKEITALDGLYAGSQEYGSISIGALEGSMVTVYIDG